MKDWLRSKLDSLNIKKGNFEGLVLEPSEVYSLGKELMDSIEAAKREAEVTERIKEGYADLLKQLIGMLNNAGYLWHKDENGEYLFATGEWCEFFWKDSSCDVVGWTDQGLRERFFKRFPEGVFTFAEGCTVSDEFARNAGKKCRFIEIGKRGVEKPGEMVALKTDKTPLFFKDKYIGVVGMAMEMNCHHLTERVKDMVERGVAESIASHVFYLKDNPKCEVLFEDFGVVE